MPLVIDSSRAFRSPKELIDLIQAVLSASPNDEATWIEWKNGLVLTDKEVRVHIARHVLGMANRSVEEATRHAEGCGYIVIGTEPGHCGGVTEIDPAEAELEEYFSECWTYYTQVAVSRLLERGELRVPLTLVNISDRNYTDVRIETYLRVNGHGR